MADRRDPLERSVLGCMASDRSGKRISIEDADAKDELAVRRADCGDLKSVVGK
jgi:hypothetical protein